LAARPGDRGVKDVPTFADLFNVMAAASVGDASARVSLPERPQRDDPATRLGIALNVLLDDLSARATAAAKANEDMRASEARYRVRSFS